MYYNPHNEEEIEKISEYNELEWRAKRLRRREQLHPQDPEALDDEEKEFLNDIEQRLRNL